MPYFNGFKCKICGIVKKETNHWWNILELLDPLELRFKTFNVAAVKDETEDCVCGHECSQKVLELWQQVVAARSHQEEMKNATIAEATEL